MFNFKSMFYGIKCILQRQTARSWKKKKNNKINVSQQIAVDKETLQKKVEFDRPGERSPE